MPDWFFGAIAEAAYYVARFHERRAARLIARARTSNEAAERASLVQRWADGTESWSSAKARYEREARGRHPFAMPLIEGARHEL